MILVKNKIELIESMRHFEKQKLLSDVSNDISFYEELMNTAKTSLKKYVSNLKAAHEAMDMSQVKFWAHSIKGTAISIYCPILAKYGKELETVVSEDRVADVKLANEIKQLIDLINKEIQILINDHF